MSELFDEVCRVLAEPVPRRTALRRMFGVVATGATVLLLPRRAWAGPAVPAVPGAAGGLVASVAPGNGAGICNLLNCTTGGPGPCDGGGGIFCCPPGGALCAPNAVGATCCPAANPVCSGNQCCPPGSPGHCGPGMCCAGPGQCCPLPGPPAAAPACCPAGSPFCCINAAAIGNCCRVPGCVCNPAPGGGFTCCCPGGVDPTVLLSGGGAFLSPGNCKLLFQTDVACCPCAGTGASCSCTGGCTGATTCFDVCTSTLIQFVSVDSFQGTSLGGGNFQASGTGAARVNGVSTNISFTAAKASGVTSFQITNTSTDKVIAAGSGESGLADLGLQIFEG